MTLNTYTAEGGTNGTAVATTDTGSGTAFTDVTPGTGGSITYATAASQKGSLGLSFAAAASASCFTDWVNVAGSSASAGFALRGYFYIPTLPTASAQPLFTVRTSGGGTGVLTYQLGTTGTGSHLFVTLDSNAGATLASSTSTYSFLAATWYRIESQASNASSTTGTLAYQIYLGDSTTAVTGGTVSLTGVNLFSTTALGTVRWGRPAAVGSAFTVYLDDLAFQTATTTAIGPSSSLQVASGSVSTSGSGSLGLVTSTLAVTAPIFLADDGTTVFTGTPTLTGSVALSDDGSLSASGTSAQTATGSMALSGSGTFTDATNGITTSGSDGLTGSGTLSGTASALTASGTRAFTGLGTLVPTGTPFFSGTEAGAGAGTLASTGTVFTRGSVALSGGSALGITGARGSFKYIASVTHAAAASTSIALTVPAGVVNTHLGVLLIGTGTNGTDTFSVTGWTSRMSNPTGENNTEAAVLTRLGGMTAGDTVTVTGTIAHFTTIMAVWYDSQGFDVVTVGNPGTRNGTSSVYTTIGGLTTTALKQPVLVCLTERSTATGTTVTGFTGGAGMQPTTDAFYEDPSSSSSVSLWCGSAAVQDPGVVPSLTAQYSTASTNGTGIMLAIYAPDNVGSAALGSEGTLGAVGHPVGSVAFGAEGTLTLDTPNKTGALTFTGGSTLVAVKVTTAPIFQFNGTSWVAINVYRFDGNGWVATAAIAY